MGGCVLIVDDEPDIRALLEITLQRMGLESRAAGDVAQARSALDAERFDLCLTDLKLPDGDGIDIVEHIQRDPRPIPVAVFTAHGDMETAVRALKAGAFDFVSKPVDLALLRRLVTAALRPVSEPAPGTAGEDPTACLIGRSQAIGRLRQTIRKLARSQAPVHIAGESGTGKELVARLIHTAGPRAGERFVPINCGAIPTELMESELFGHRKGSFTGAVADSEGLFRAADGGTLFLDEVAELPMHMQAKLLRAIQEKAVRPVGAKEEIPVDVRLVSATNEDLAGLVERGRFRQDLYYRINVIAVEVPPLRERREDVPLLARHLLHALAGGNGAAPGLSDAAVAALRAYDFPGNVRELENVLERALALCEQGTIEPADLQLPAGAVTAGGGNGAGRLTEQLDEIERESIVRALEATRWNRSAAARQLGLTLRQLRYRLKKMDIG